MYFILYPYPIPFQRLCASLSKIIEPLQKLFSKSSFGPREQPLHINFMGHDYLLIDLLDPASIKSTLGGGACVDQ